MPMYFCVENDYGSDYCLGKGKVMIYLTILILNLMISK